MTERFYIVPGVGALTAIGCCFYSCYRKYVRIDLNGPMNEVTASTVIVIDNTSCNGHVISILELEQASAIGVCHQRDDENDSIPEPIQITQTASSVPIIAQSCSAYRWSRAHFGRRGVPAQSIKTIPSFFMMKDSGNTNIAMPISTLPFRTTLSEILECMEITWYLVIRYNVEYHQPRAFYPCWLSLVGEGPLHDG